MNLPPNPLPSVDLVISFRPRFRLEMTLDRIYDLKHHPCKLEEHAQDTINAQYTCYEVSDANCLTFTLYATYLELKPALFPVGGCSCASPFGKRYIVQAKQPQLECLPNPPGPLSSEQSSLQ